MILGLLRCRRDGRLSAADRIRQAPGLFVATWGCDLDPAFWKAHDRGWDRTTPAPDRRMWVARLAEIDSHRSPTRPHADTATRMLFRDEGLGTVRPRPRLVPNALGTRPLTPPAPSKNK